MLPLLFLFSSFHLYIHSFTHSLGLFTHSFIHCFFSSSFLLGFFCFFFCFLAGQICFCCFWQLRRINENIGIVCFLPHFLPFIRLNASLVLRGTLSMGKAAPKSKNNHSGIKFIHEIQRRRASKKIAMEGKKEEEQRVSTQQWTFLGPVCSLLRRISASSPLNKRTIHEWANRRRHATGST